MTEPRDSVVEALKRQCASVEADRRQLASLLNSTPNHIFSLDLEGRFIYLNAAAASVIANAAQGRDGLSSILGRTGRELGFKSEFLAQFETQLGKARSGETVVAEAIFPTANTTTNLRANNLRMYEYVLSPIRGEDGRVTGVAGVSRDVNQLLERFFMLSSDLMCIAGVDGFFKRVSPSFEILGYRSEELLAQPFVDFVHPDDRSATIAEVERLAKGLPTIQFENRYRCKNGVYRFLSWSAASDSLAGTIYAIARDVTDSKRAEELHARMVAIVSDSVDAIIGMSLEGTVTSWNQAAEGIFGYSAEEILGQPLAILMPARFHESESLRIARIAKGERVAHFETVRRRKDGKEVDLSVTYSPVRDQSGDMIGISKIARDISDRKRIERALARAMDTTEASNRELEAFSYSVAHDLRTPLRSIDGFSQALLEDYGDKLDEDGRKYLRFVRESAQLMAQLIDDMLTLSRVTRSELCRERVDLSALARATHSLLDRRDPGRSVEVVIQEGLITQGDSRLLAVVFDNLFGNAWKFTSKRTGARIEFGATSKDGIPTYFVRDNGAGFDMTYANKLFGVFQRLHAAHEFEGTGVGLATVQRIVHRHEGRVWAEGKVGAGATIFFTLGEREGTHE